MKGNPNNPYLVEIELTDRFMDFFKYEFRSAVEKDKRDRWVWQQKMAKYHARRYALDRRKPSFPFPGSADVWPPLVDMIIEQMKAMYLSPLLMGNPPVNAVALGQNEDDRAPDIETWFEYQINHGSPKFMREQAYYIDDILSCGWGVLKTFWAYETRTAPETLKRETLPDEIAQRVLFRTNDENMNSLGLSEKIFDDLATESQVFGNQIYPSTYTLLEGVYDLDREDPTDRLAILQIMGWMRQGAREPLTIQKRDTVVDAPGTAAVLGENLIMPTSATDTEDCFHISHEMWKYGFQIRQKVRDGLWRPESVDQLMARGKGAEDPRFVRTGIQSVEAARQGLNYSGSEKYYILESCTWFDHDEDLVDSKIIILWSPAAEKPFRAYLYDRPSGRWPYHITEFERNKRGIYAARGIPERLQDIEREVVVQKRAELNRLMISSALSLMVRSTSPLANQAIRWIPGEKLIVNDVDRDAKPLVFPDLSVTFQQQERLWKVWAESYTGTPNYAISDPLSNLNEPRTKYEIQSIQGQGQSIGNFRTAIHREAMSEVFQEMFTLFQVQGPRSQWVPVTGSEPIEITREELQGSYRFMLGPIVGMENPELEAQKALARLQVLMQVAASGQLPPSVMIDLGAATELYLRKDDPRAAKAIMKKRTPEEMQQMQKQDQQQSAMQGAIQGLQAGSGVKARGA